MTVDPAATRINVSGTTFQVPHSLFSYLKDLPWCSKHEVKQSADGVVTLDADPNAFHWLLHFVQHQSLPDSYWQEQDVKALEVLAVVLGIPELVLYLGNHSSPRAGFLKNNLKRSSSWQRRAKAQGKRKLDALAATIVRGKTIRKSRAQSYKELVH